MFLQVASILRPSPLPEATVHIAETSARSSVHIQVREGENTFPREPLVERLLPGNQEQVQFLLVILV